MPLIAAEDTRLTRRLFARYEITTHLVSYHAQSGQAREDELLAHLRSGRDLALVTDAGTPLVSDPGAELAAAWAAEGGVVVPIPGASAVLAALVASGLSVARWTFEGFLPRSGRERRERLARIAVGRAGLRRLRGPVARTAHARRSGRCRRPGSPRRRVPRAHETPRGSDPRALCAIWRRGPKRAASPCAANSRSSWRPWPRVRRRPFPAPRKRLPSRRPAPRSHAWCRRA